MEVSGQFQAALPQGEKENRDTLHRKLGGGLSAGLDVVTKKILNPHRELNPCRPTRSLVAIPTEMSEYSHYYLK